MWSFCPVYASFWVFLAYFRRYTIIHLTYVLDVSKRLLIDENDTVLTPFNLTTYIHIQPSATVYNHFATVLQPVATTAYHFFVASPARACPVGTA